MRGLWTGASLALLLGGCYQGLDGDGGFGQATDGAASAGDDGGADGADDDGGVAAQCAEDGPRVGGSGLRLLTRYEYDNTIRDLLGDETAPARAFPPENQTTAFENNYVDHRASKDLVRQYMDASESIAARAVDERLGSLLPCDPLVVGEAVCGHLLVETLLPRAFRRPANDAEIAAFISLFDASHGEFGFSEAVALVLQATLQSPQFLYRVELQPEVPAPGDVVVVEGHEMASRLSYFLTASMPDDELLAAADAGTLATAEGIEAQARRLLETDAGRQAVREFHRQWLRLSALPGVSKDPALFPTLDHATAGEGWKQSVEAFAEYVFFDGDGTLATLLESDAVFLTPALAAEYGAGAPDPVTGAYTLPGEHAGLLTQPGLMALLSFPDQSSPIARGVFVRERLLCQHLPAPPNNVVIEPPDPDPNATTRERFAQHTEDPSCAGCHALIDPLGFGFEHYDAIGNYRAVENGLAVDARGELTAIEDAEAGGAFDGAQQLAGMLAASDDFSDCVVHQWTTFALGREPTEADECSVAHVRQSLTDSGGDLREMLVAITTSDAFRHRIIDSEGP
jgi:hypothetical protein